MIVTDRGLVLRTYKLRDTSLIASVLGFEAGRVRLVAHAARAARSPLAACRESGNEIDFVYSWVPGRELATLREVSLRAGHLSGASRLERLATGWAAVELLDRLVPEGAHEPGLGIEATDLLARLRDAPDRATALLLLYGFELQLLRRFGLEPSLSVCDRCRNPAGEASGSLDVSGGTYRCSRCGGAPGAGRVTVPATAGKLLALLQADPTSPPPSTPRDRRAVGLCLHQLLTTHLDRYRWPRGLDLLKKVDAVPRPHATRTSG